MYLYFRSKCDWDRSTMHPKFSLTAFWRVRCSFTFWGIDPSCGELSSEQMTTKVSSNTRGWLWSLNLFGSRGEEIFLFGSSTTYTEVLHTPSSTRLGFKPISRSWTVHFLYPWEAIVLTIGDQGPCHIWEDVLYLIFFYRFHRPFLFPANSQSRWIIYRSELFTASSLGMPNIKYSW